MQRDVVVKDTSFNRVAEGFASIDESDNCEIPQSLRSNVRGT
jgi:hypothetical protein